MTDRCATEADDYSSNGSADASFRVLLVGRMVVGKALKRRTNATDLTELPCGYHSVRVLYTGIMVSTYKNGSSLANLERISNFRSMSCMTMTRFGLLIWSFTDTHRKTTRSSKRWSRRCSILPSCHDEYTDYLPILNSSGCNTIYSIFIQAIDIQRDHASDLLGKVRWRWMIISIVCTFISCRE